MNSISGNYIWIIGGSFIKTDKDDFIAVGPSFNPFDLATALTEPTSLIWSIKRHKWITGTQLPDLIKEDSVMGMMGIMKAI